MLFPTGLALDARGDVYVANRSGNTITVYAPAANGNAVPIRTIEGSMTDLNEPTSIAIDAEQGVYVTNLADRSVTLFARGASGDVAPVRIIRGKRAALTAAFAIAVDRAGTVYVVNSDEKGISGEAAGPERSVFFAKRANGNATPIYSIAGSATRLRPYGLTIDRTGEIDVVNQTD